MPTRRPRHTITETPAVQRALRRLQALDPGAPIDLKELVILGADTRSEALEGGDGGGRRDSLVEAFLALRADEHLEAVIGLSLHDAGWAHEA